jgi:hypothetical protein
MMPGFGELMRKVSLEKVPTAILSQGYESAVNTRGIVIIDSDDATIGLVAVVPIGITEISSINLQVEVGQRDGSMIGTLSATAPLLLLTDEVMPPGPKPAKTSPRHLDAESSFDLLARAHDGPPAGGLPGLPRGGGRRWRALRRAARDFLEIRLAWRSNHPFPLDEIRSKHSNLSLLAACELVKVTGGRTVCATLSPGEQETVVAQIAALTPVGTQKGQCHPFFEGAHVRRVAHFPTSAFRTAAPSQSALAGTANVPRESTAATTATAASFGERLTVPVRPFAVAPFAGATFAAASFAAGLLFDRLFASSMFAWIVRASSESGATSGSMRCQ